MSFLTEVVYVPRAIMALASLLAFGMGAVLGAWSYRELYDSEE